MVDNTNLGKIIEGARAVWEEFSHVLDPLPTAPRQNGSTSDQVPPIPKYCPHCGTAL